MTPLEVNKKIAEIKGYKIRRVHEDGSVFIGKEGKDGFFAKWAEDISDAWELFEEMPNCALLSSSGITQQEMGYAPFICSFGLTYDTPSKVDGDTAHMAICKAWLRWKGGVNE